MQERAAVAAQKEAHRERGALPFEIEISPINDDRNLGVREHALRLAADEQAAEAAASVRGYQDDIAAVLLRRFDDADIRRGFDARHAGARHARVFGGALDLAQMLARFVLGAGVEVVGRLDGNVRERRVRVLRQARISRDARAPTDCARSIAPSMAFCDSSEPSVGTRMCLNMASSSERRARFPL